MKRFNTLSSPKIRSDNYQTATLNDRLPKQRSSRRRTRGLRLQVNRWRESGIQLHYQLPCLRIDLLKQASEHGGGVEVGEALRLLRDAWIGTEGQGVRD